MTMSTAARCASVFVFALSAEVFAQEPSTRLVINGKALPGATEVRVRVVGQELVLLLSPDRTATTRIPVVEGPVSLTIETRQTGYGTHKWAKTIELNGSGNLEYVLNPDGTGSMGQWPAVVWDAAGGQFDVLVNGTVLGSTRIKRGVEPNRTHLFVWQQQGARKCEKQVSLPMNVKRSYVCDPATGVVSEQ